MLIAYLRLEKQNPICTLKPLVWNRNNFHVPTNAELRQGQIRVVNIMDPLQTLLPPIDRASLNIITGGPYQVRLANGYITSIQVIIRLLSLKFWLLLIYKSRRENSERTMKEMEIGKILTLGTMIHLNLGQQSYEEKSWGRTMAPGGPRGSLDKSNAC